MTEGFKRGNRDTTTEVDNEMAFMVRFEIQISSLLCPSLPQGDSTNDLSCGLWLLIMSSGWDVSNTNMRPQGESTHFI